MEELIYLPILTYSHLVYWRGAIGGKRESTWSALLLKASDVILLFLERAPPVWPEQEV